MVIARVLIDNKECYAEARKDGLYLIEGSCFNIVSIASKPYSGEYRLLPPVNPSKIVALGANYRKHASELNLQVNSDPTIFQKPITSLIAEGENIILPACSTKVDYEAELVIVIAKDCRKVAKDTAYDYILGYTCANDVSERVFQKLDGQWTRAKGFDTFCPLGPYLVTGIDANDLNIKAVRNGETVQESRTSNMIHTIPEIVSFVSGVMTLKAGDIILTGTPERVGQIVAGDTIQIIIENVGCLTNKVISE
ncbi:MAG: FAA hydrolase family protein [Clostridia bacterium]|nr:FAA hydrolase family protein [Clostridia bacterium]